MAQPGKCSFAGDVERLQNDRFEGVLNLRDLGGLQAASGKVEIQTGCTPLHEHAVLVGFVQFTERICACTVSCCQQTSPHPHPTPVGRTFSHFNSPLHIVSETQVKYFVIGTGHTFTISCLNLAHGNSNRKPSPVFCSEARG